VSGPEITRIAHVALVVGDITEAELFFEEAFDFVTLERRIGDRAQAELYGVPHAQLRETVMELDAQRLSLLAFDVPGAPYPHGSTSTDLWFQHFAIIVSDMDAAYARLTARRGFTPISEGGPVRLPESSGGVTAFKFRDGDGHPLELLAFPAGSGPAYWERKRDDALFLGIDHTAIAVGDTARSIAFFDQAFGLELGTQSENVGIEQARLDAVPDARVTVSGLNPKTAPPHLELLGYHVGPRRPIAHATTSRDLAATHVVLDTHDLPAVVDARALRLARHRHPGRRQGRDHGARPRRPSLRRAPNLRSAAS
jgi:catechol 2,3-dioxygenase-like lactoylglutathione lyase family enzyme